MDSDFYCDYVVGYYFSVELMQCCWQVYLGDLVELLVLVLLVYVIDLKGLVFVFVFSCEYDLLCDEVEYYV